MILLTTTSASGLGRDAKVPFNAVTSPSPHHLPIVFPVLFNWSSFTELFQLRPCPKKRSLTDSWSRF